MTPSCEEIRPDLGAWIDGEISAPESREIEEHLLACAGCRAETDALRRTSALLAATREAGAPRSWVLEAVRRAEGARGEAPARRGLQPVWAIPSVAAALALAIVFVALRVGQNGPALPAPPSSRAAAGESDRPMRGLTAPPAAAPAPSPVGPLAEKLAEKKRQAMDEPLKDNAVAALRARTRIDSTAPAPIATIELADIRFPAPPSPPAAIALRAETSRDALATPAAGTGAAAPKEPGSRSLRVRVRLDAESRVVSAERAGEESAADDATFIASLKGAVLHLPGAAAPLGGAVKSAAPMSLTARRAPGRADAEAPLREMLIEIRLPARPNP